MAIGSPRIIFQKVKSNDYTLLYKVLNAYGPSNILEDELNFEEFINEYKKINLSGKKMSIIVTVKVDMKRKKNKKVMYFIKFDKFYK